MSTRSAMQVGKLMGGISMKPSMFFTHKEKGSEQPPTSQNELNGIDP